MSYRAGAGRAGSRRASASAPHASRTRTLRILTVFDQVRPPKRSSPSSARVRYCLTCIGASPSSRRPRRVSWSWRTGHRSRRPCRPCSNPRRGRPFTVLQAGETPADDAERLLFGDVDEDDFLVRSDGGAVFLDDLAARPLSIQARLVVLLDRGDLVPVGGYRPWRVDVRLVVALWSDVGDNSTGAARSDLLAALGTYPIRLPPLRDRVEDAPLIAEDMLRERDRRSGQPVAPRHAGVPDLPPVAGERAGTAGGGRTRSRPGRWLSIAAGAFSAFDRRSHRFGPAPGAGR